MILVRNHGQKWEHWTKMRTLNKNENIEQNENIEHNWKKFDQKWLTTAENGL